MEHTGLVQGDELVVHTSHLGVTNDGSNTLHIELASI